MIIAGQPVTSWTGTKSNRCCLVPSTTAPPTNEPVVEPEERTAAKPAHYKVICISMYNEDLAHLDAMVERLKTRGLTKANRSALIRYALGLVDLDKVPRGL